MNSHFKRWVREAVAKRTNKGTFTSHTIMGDIVDSRGTSNSIGSVTAIGWYLSRLDNVIKVKEGTYEVKK
jgi:hypothetical protein